MKDRPQLVEEAQTADLARSRIAARIAADAPGIPFLGPNVFDSPEQRTELIAGLLALGINPRSHRVVFVMEDYSGPPNYRGASRFTELYAAAFSGLGFTTIVLCPPRPAGRNNGRAETNGIRRLKNGVIRVSYEPWDPVGENTGIPEHFHQSVASTMARMANWNLLQEILTDESGVTDRAALREFAAVEGPPTLIITENAYGLFFEHSARAARAARSGGPNWTTYMYHPNKDGAKDLAVERPDGVPLRWPGSRTEVSPYEALFLAVGEATLLTISEESAKRFRQLAEGIAQRIDPDASLPSIWVKPTGLPTESLGSIDLKTDSTGLGLEGDRINLSYMGRITAVKGAREAVGILRELLEIWEALPVKHQRFRPRLVLMGTADRNQASMNYERELREDSADLIRRGDLVMPGPVTDYVKMEVFQRSRLQLVTSDPGQESWHMASGEGRLGGCLPAAFDDIGGIHEGQRRGGGVVFATRTLRGFAEGVAQVLSALVPGMPLVDIDNPSMVLDIQNVATVDGRTSALPGRKAVIRGSEIRECDRPEAVRLRNRRVLTTYAGLAVEDRLGSGEVAWAVGVKESLKVAPPRARVPPALTRGSGVAM